jgi:hypothetical protein
MTLREQLHRVVDSLPEAEVGAALKFAEYLRDSGRGDPLPRWLSGLEEDQEDLSAEESRRVDAAMQEVERGEAIPWEQAKARLG